MADTKKPVTKTAVAKVAPSVKPAVTKKPVAKKPTTVAAAKKAVVAKKTAMVAKQTAPEAVELKTIEVKAVEVKKEVAAAKSAVTSKKEVKKVVKAKNESDRGLRKIRTGKVVSNKMNKTIVVAIVNKVPHPLYGKVVVTTTKFKAHDENNECSIGDTVEIVETRPLSRDKYFRLLRIVEKVK